MILALSYSGAIRGIPLDEGSAPFETRTGALLKSVTVLWSLKGTGQEFLKSRWLHDAKHLSPIASLIVVLIFGRYSYLIC